MKTILTIVGTRPEAIKLAPVINVLKSSPYMHNIICSTQQHSTLLETVLINVQIKTHYQLKPIASPGSLDQDVANILMQLSQILSKTKPDLIMVQGDTTTAFVGALSGFYARIPVAHIEAGLRTGNMYAPWPEEMHRCFIDKVSKFCFCPTNRAKDNLIKEGIPPNKIWVVGNTSIDAIRLVAPTSASLEAQNKLSFILVTIHRRENHGITLQYICHALRLLAQQFPSIKIVWCLHPNPSIYKIVKKCLSHIGNIECLTAVEHKTFIELLSTCLFVISDSGGIQEEVTFIGKPILIIRNTTERPEVVEAGTGILVGTNPQNIVKTASKLLAEPKTLAAMSKIHFPYGKGYAAQKIVAILEKTFKRQQYAW